MFTYIHGISYEQVRDQPAFGSLWQELSPMLQGARFLAAHNASFDRGVLEACCDAAGLPRVTQPFLCTVRLARQQWRMKPANLPAVCANLGIELVHHEALSDAEACAKIVLAAAKEGNPLEPLGAPKAPRRAATFAA